jgi:hypothetical protein
MIQTGHGRPLRVFALGALLLLAPLLAPGSAAAQAVQPYGNVVELAVPRPASDQVVIERVRVSMALRAGVRPRPLGRLNVRRAGGRLPRGFAIAGVRARPRGNVVTVRLAAVRTSAAARGGAPLRVRLRIGGRHVVFRRARTSTIAIAPDRLVSGQRDCARMSREARGWTPVGGLRAVALGDERFGARVAVGAAQQRACRRRLAAVLAVAAARFLAAVDEGFAAGPDGAIQGFFATWVKNPDGTAKVCVYVRGAPGGTGDVTVASTTQPFRLDAERGVARTVTQVAGEGDYAFTVRWRRGSTYERSGGVVSVPPGDAPGDPPPAPYSAAGSCA